MQWRADAAIPFDLCRVFTDERRAARRLCAKLAVHSRKSKGLINFYDRENRKEDQKTLQGVMGVQEE